MKNIVIMLWLLVVLVIGLFIMYFYGHLFSYCPFRPIKAISGNSSTEISGDYTSTIVLQLDRIRKSSPLDAELINKFSDSIKYISKRTIAIPMDTAFAGRYNAHRGVLCGYWHMFNQVNDKNKKEEYEDKIDHVINQILEMPDNSITDQTSTGLYTYYRKKIDSLFIARIENATTEFAKERWQGTYSKMGAYLKNCENRPDYQDCFYGTWQKVLALEE
jgi:hypothetical protein